MKAAVLTEINKPLQILDITHEELKTGQIKVKIHYSGVCHSQIMEITGKRGEDKYLPHLLGHEAVGEVVEVGPSTTKFEIGEKVILTWLKCSGLNATPAKYFFGNQIINSGQITTFSNYSIISENKAVKLPKNLPLTVAPLFGCALATGAGMVLNQLKPNSGSNIAIIGLGGIGLCALMAAKTTSPKHLIAVDINEKKLSLAKELGATTCIKIDEKIDLIDELKKENIDLVDYAVEATGIAKMIEAAFAIVKPIGGICIFASHPQFGDKIRIDPFDLIKGKSIIGSWGGGTNDPDKFINQLANLYLNGQLPLEKLTNKVYDLNQINQSIEDLKSGVVNRPIIRMSHEY